MVALRTGFDEEGEKGVIIGDVYCGGVSLYFKPICKRKYITREIDISDINTYDELISKILSEVNSEEFKQNFYKIILKGEIKEHFSLNERILSEKIKGKFYYIKIVNTTSIAVDLDQVSQDYSVKGKFVAKIMKKIEEASSDDEKDLLRLALKLGIQCLSEEEVNLNDY